MEFPFLREDGIPQGYNDDIQQNFSMEWNVLSLDGFRQLCFRIRHTQSDTYD